ncbi:MAG: GTP-binding protein LepA [Verrucomicrobia subdivision 6 bacterium BACL9 MAG-120924-bin69]|jgi:GTP-binding protein LepA|uniref:Elongation factor 4 n=3 Tax=Verrucomicrobia subdivision 6 TaxID=134627 RepID=A0A0R2XBN8_9BACT|nr:MAG: GTP-binding protein LepA [Verrucomicrobia subdivision 6 bacterium BACL9 MAG-120507-bin52]KRP33298.1 MAG: GTP-binding protein LepA [Verrucomicrobia subdivision 6 bacterium BACL9 MAG-120820-bin42]KRP33777.1 MAG: GTP-binding protein LepA [Verrucomicrobia subdivision 6 bacterium BACL9 MAG-120924-bin69]HCP06816.1 elongation factor 4 [Verrucomicrobiales bacterium]
MEPNLIRNFCIIAHVDHGKTTLSDRLLQVTGLIAERDMQAQLLDSMDLERERGITIKAHPVTLSYTAKNGKTYRLNLIDTPGHVDFSYEVSRSLAACEGALLVVDAAQGVEAQTVANVHLANKEGLTLIPIINKIDLPSSDIPGVKKQLEEILSIPGEEAILVSAKTGQGIEDVLEAIVARLPAPEGADGKELKALVFDSVFDTFRGVIAYVRVIAGELTAGTPIMLMQSGRKYEVKEVGTFCPKMVVGKKLGPGDSGYLVANLRTTAEIDIGDTITHAIYPAKEPLTGFRKVQPMVFSGLYPINTDDFEKLKLALGKLQVNDSSLVFIPESSPALGFGFRCGFLGLLHMEIVQERLSREFGMEVLSTYPSVIYEVRLTSGKVLSVENPVQLPDPSVIEEIREPMVTVFLLCPNENIGDLVTMVREKRGEVTKTDSLDAKRVMLTTQIPLSEILVDFSDRIKSITRGYGSMDYEHGEYRADDLVKLEILVNGEPMDAFSCIVHREKAPARGRALTAKLKEVIPPQLFKVSLQAAIGGKIVAREDVKSFGKNVTAKCYGGDITRKRKLLEKQKEGKKRMKQFGKVNIPQEAFLQVLKAFGD